MRRLRRGRAWRSRVDEHLAAILRARPTQAIPARSWQAATECNQADRRTVMAKITTKPMPGAVTSPHPSWWRLGSTATRRVARSHGWRATAENGSARWIGHEWSGRSDIRLGRSDYYPGLSDDEPRYEVVSAETASHIVEILRAGITVRNIPVARLPDHRSVRRDGWDPYKCSTLVFDIDFGEFILPVGMSADVLSSHPHLTSLDVAAGMIDAITRAHADRDQHAAREIELRCAFEEQARLASVTPLWFRLMPWTFNPQYVAPFGTTYEMIALMLDQDLRPILGQRLTNSDTDIERYLGFHGEMQRRRAANRSKLEALGSAGFVTDVAFGLMQARGMEPREVLNYLRVSRLAGDHAGVLYQTATTRETLTLVEGVLDATIKFDGGDYADGKLTLEGDYPKTLAMAAKRRPMTAFVDHPAFRLAGTTIRQARSLKGRLRLYHTVQRFPVENASRARAGVEAKR